MNLEKSLQELWQEIERQAQTKGVEWKAKATYSFLEIRDLLVKS
jgi:hypothetical protein